MQGMARKALRQEASSVFLRNVASQCGRAERQEAGLCGKEGGGADRALTTTVSGWALR